MSTPSNPLVQILRPFGLGPRVGERLEIPASAIGVVVSRNGDALDRLPPGLIEISPLYFPNTFSFFRINQAPGTLIDCAILAVYPAGSRMLQWSSEYLISNIQYPGINIGQLAGLAQVRITEPGAFIGSLLNYLKECSQAGHEHRSFQLTLSSGKQWAVSAVASLPELAASLLESVIADLVTAAAMEALAKGPAPNTAKLTIQYQAQSSIEEWMQRSGMKLEGFSVEEMPLPVRAPCRSCQSATAPTAYATFHRNISLFITRFHTKEEGNYCLPCGVKTGLRDIAIMLVCGWWGIIGFILTPFLILWDLFSVIRIAIGPRRASTQAEAPAADATFLGPSV